MPSKQFFRRNDSHPRTPPRPATSPAASTPYSPFRRHPLGRADDGLPSTPDSPSVGVGTPSASSSLNGYNNALSRTWSIGSIPIVYNPSSSPSPNAWNPAQQLLPNSAGDSPTLPSGLGSVSYSPQVRQSPQSFGYPTSPSDDPASPSGGSSVASPSASPNAKRRGWRSRFDAIEKATSALRNVRSGVEPHEDEPTEGQRAVVGLGVEAPGADVLASPILPLGSPKTYLSSRFRSARRSGSVSPYASPDPASIPSDDQHLPLPHARDNHNHDDGDAGSLFSLSAYYDHADFDSPALSQCEQRFDQQHLLAPKRPSPVLGPAISFDAFPRATTRPKDVGELDPFFSPEPRHTREASGRTARLLARASPAPPSRAPSPPTAQGVDIDKSNSDATNSGDIESAPLSTMSTTTDSSTSYSSFSTASVSTQPTEVALSSSCEETGGESDAAAAPKAPSRLLQRASTAQTSRVVTEFPPLQGRFRSSSVIVPPSPVGPDFQRDLTQQPPTSSSLGSIASTPKTQQQLGRKPATPIPRHMVTPETPIIFAQRPGVTTPPLSYLYPGSKPPTSLPSSYPATPATPAYTDSESTGRRAPAVASIDKLSSYYQPSKDGLLCHADGRGGSRAGSSAGNALLPSPIDPYNVPEPQTSQRERERTTSSAISVTGSQRTSQLSGSSLSLASSSFVHVNLPAKIAFLRDTIIELHIDQEGFRAIKPKFRLYRHSYTSFKSSTPDLVGPQLGTSSAVMAPNPSYLTRHSRSDSRATGTGPSALGSCFEDDYYGEYGLVEFRMTTRDTFIFHHAKFDSPPTLRRVTLNGDESKDYISREASLSLKENGVYTAQGWEDKAKLFWKLEYLVDDRKATNGLDVHGEKTLTPMTFTCSPFLLDPERGKKIGVFQVVKKSITPKISSSKLRPPKVVSPPKARSVSAKVEGSKSESAAPPLPSIPVHQTPKQPLSRMPNQNVDPATIHDISSIHSSGVRSAFSKILSRPSTPARPGTPKRPKTPNKRPSTASKAIGPSEPSPVDEVADPFAKLAPSNFTASDWARRAANATANRPRAVSAAAQRPALFSSPMNFDLDTLPSLAQLSSRGARTNVQPTGSFATSSDKAAPSLPMPHLPGPIVPPQQLEQWMSDTQKSSGGLLSLPPPRGLGSTPRPLLPKRPSTASNDGRPWNKS